MKNFVHKILALSILPVFFWLSCSKEPDEFHSNKSPKTWMKSSEGIMYVSYQVTTQRSFDSDFSNLGDLDLSEINPRNEKQSVSMELLPDGQINMTIESLDWDKKTVIPHQVLPNPEPQIKKTVITHNTAYFYDKNGQLLATEHIDLPNFVKLANQIKEIGDNYTAEQINKVISTLQGQSLAAHWDEYIQNAAENNVQITDRGNGLITISVPFGNLDPGMEETAVLLVDKIRNKLLGFRIYDTSNNLLQSVLFAYNKGDIEYLKAIRVVQPFRLPSGNTINMITLYKIDNFHIELNI